jgi:hypothetical protein
MGTNAILGHIFIFWDIHGILTKNKIIPSENSEKAYKQFHLLKILFSKSYNFSTTNTALVH